MFKIRRTPENRIYLCGFNEWPVEREIKSPELFGWLNSDKNVDKEPFGFYKINVDKEQVLSAAANNPKKFNAIWGGLFRQLCRVVWDDLADLI